MNERWFEDFTIGDVIISKPKILSEEEIVEFASHFDPQYFHISVQDAVTGPFEGLIASGWHVCAVTFRLFMDTNPYGKASLGAPGVDNVRWLYPVRPNDSLQVKVTVSAKRLSVSKPDRGLIYLDWEVSNQNKVSVMTMAGPIMLLCRPSS